MRILIVSYHLYPDKTAEGICVAKVARALVDAGHELTIVTSTANDLSGSFCTPTLPLLNGTSVYRVEADPDMLPKWTKPFYSAAHQTTAARPLNRILRKAGTVPVLFYGAGQEELAWSMTAARQIELLHNEHGGSYDVIHSRLYPSVSHLAVLLALPRLKPRPKWSAYFSDPWPPHLSPEPYRRQTKLIFRRRSEMLLMRMLKNADGLVFPSSRTMLHLLVGTRRKFQSKAHCIPHLGNFWLEKLYYGKTDQFRVVFAGDLTKERDHKPFLEALQRLIGNSKQACLHLTVQFMGKNMHGLRASLVQYQLEDVVHVSDQKPFEEVWTSLCEADVLLLIEAPLKEGIFMPSKLAEYISARRPILALSPATGTVADFLAQGGGLRVDPDDPAQILEGLTELYNRWASDTLEELCPPQELIDAVSPQNVVPAYKKAFHFE